MKKKVSECIAEVLARGGINTVFTVVGGGAMHLNDSLGHHPGLHCVYHHHEQAAAMAAEGYAKLIGKPGCVCVTSGPGAINALNGVVGAFQDSMPMIVLSGQTKSYLTVRSTDLKLRTLGNQEFDIISAISGAVKYGVMLTDPSQVVYELEKALFIAIDGRPGPVWLDIPLDIQGTYIETDNLPLFDPRKEDNTQITECKLKDFTKKIIDKLATSKRPVIYAGNGIRISGGSGLLQDFSSALSIPIVTCWDSIDLVETQSNMYVGRAGTMGDRAGNFAVQNSDLLLCIGSRLNVYQVGYDKSTWAREAYVVMVDIDEEELKKPTIRVDMPICCDASLFMGSLLDEGSRSKYDFCSIFSDWIARCQDWKQNYPVVLDKHLNQKKKTNVYAFMYWLSHMIGDNSITVVANGSASVVGSQAYYIGHNQRFIMNCGLSSMGYELPASIGACVAADGQPIICVAGDGSIQMNMQELQTIVTNRLPIKIFIINNEGYHQIRLTQKNIFKDRALIGIGPESGDLEFPDFERIAYAYKMMYFGIHNNNELPEVIKRVLAYDNSCICEVFCDTEQIFEPKSATRKKDDGTLYSPPLEDLAPFLDRKELISNMVISVKEEMLNEI